MVSGELYFWKQTLVQNKSDPGRVSSRYSDSADFSSAGSIQESLKMPRWLCLFQIFRSPWIPGAGLAGTFHNFTDKETETLKDRVA